VTGSTAVPDTAPPDAATPTADESPSPSITAKPTPDSSSEQKPGSTPTAGAQTPAPTPGTDVVQPPLLSQMVEKAELSFDDIGCSQLILVNADKTNADIYCYDKGENGLWKLNETLGYIKGYVGRNGVSVDKHEGDGCSPGGLFSLSYAFGNNAKPETGLSWRAITKDTYWIDDPNSKYYNQWVENVDDADWTGGEHLSENVVSYAYAVVIDYNTAPNTVAGKGSAIFFHIGNKPTSGCVVVTKDTLLNVLKWLSEDKNPGMLIVAE
jgi:L,D-peptidoglycan transpeptidase YkuD (ErfK/YbiS/YcfS/YnhG family)